jgi:hypothetical protein
MRFIANTLSIILLITFFDACNDDNQPLPPITSTGAGTFGCIIDGKVYVPYGYYSDPMVQTTADMIVVYGGMEDVNFTLAVHDTTDQIVEHKPYRFEDQKGIYCKYHTWQGKSDCMYDEFPVSGYITFTKIDYEKHIISGVFEFTAFSSTCNRTVTITDGRFDLRTDL